MKRDLIDIVISSSGQDIGRMHASEFMAYMNRPRRFLADLVTDFNALKARLGEPERARQELRK